MKIMQLKSFLFIVFIVFFYSCGSQKNTTASRKVVNQRNDDRVRVPISKEKEIDRKEIVREPKVNKPKEIANTCFFILIFI